MEDIIYTKKYDSKAEFSGSLFIELYDESKGYLTWRRCLLDGTISECAIVLLRYKSWKVFDRYVLKMYSKNPDNAVLYIRQDMSEISKYHVITPLWHVVERNDGSAYAMMLDHNVHFRGLIHKLKKVLGKRLVEEDRIEGTAMYKKVEFGRALLPHEGKSCKDDEDRKPSGPQNLYGPGPAGAEGASGVDQSVGDWLRSFHDDIDEDDYEALPDVDELSVMGEEAEEENQEDSPMTKANSPTGTKTKGNFNIKPSPPPMRNVTDTPDAKVVSPVARPKDANPKSAERPTPKPRTTMAKTKPPGDS